MKLPAAMLDAGSKPNIDNLRYCHKLIITREQKSLLSSGVGGPPPTHWAMGGIYKR